MRETISINPVKASQVHRRSPSACRPGRMVGYRTEAYSMAHQQGPEQLGSEMGGCMEGGTERGSETLSDEARIVFNTQAFPRSKSKGGSWAPCLIPSLPHHLPSTIAPRCT